MTSKISYSKFIKEDIRHRGWLAALSWVLLLLCTTVNIMLRLEESLSSDALDRTAQLREIRNLFPGLMNGSCNLFLLAVIMLLAVLAAVTGFSYLHSREKIDLYHSLPLSRQQLFLISYLGGLLAFVIPYLTACLLTMLAGVAYEVMTVSILGKSCMAILGGILGFLLIYHLTIFAMMLTGKPVTGILAAATMLVYGTMVSILGRELLCYFFSTYTVQNQGILDKLYGFLSPWAMLGQLLGTTAYTDNRSSTIFSYYIRHFFISYDTRSIPVVLAVTVLFLAILLVLAVLLYKKRPSESAGNALAFPWTAPFIKVMVSVPTALFLGALIGSMYSSNTKWIILISILSVILLCAVIEFIYHMDLRRLFAGKYSSLISFAGVAGILCILQFDLFGYDTWIPEAGSLESMALDINDIYSYFCYPDYISYGAVQPSSPDLLKEEECQLTDFSPIYELAQEGIENHRSGLDKESGVNITVRYNKKSGKPVYRHYVVSKEHALDTLTDLCEEESYRKQLFPIFHVEDKDVLAIRLTDLYYEPELLELTHTEQEALLDAYKQDVLKADIKELQYKAPVGELSIDLPEDRRADIPVYEYDPKYTVTVPNFYLYENYENSLALLEKYGYPIRREIDPEDVVQVTVNETAFPDTVNMDAYGNTIASDVGTESVVTDPKEIQDIVSQIQYTSARLLGNDEVYPRSVDLVFKNNPEPMYYVLP